jgi:kinase
LGGVPVLPILHVELEPRATPLHRPLCPRPTTSARRLLRLSFLPSLSAKDIRRRSQGATARCSCLSPRKAATRGSLGKGFGFNKGFAAKHDLGDEVGWGHFGYTCVATVKKGTRKRESVTIRAIPKAKVMFSSHTALL